MFCLFKVRPGGVGTCDLYEDGGAEESGDGVRTEGLHCSRDLHDAGGGGHLQGAGEQQHTGFSTVLKKASKPECSAEITEAVLC